MPLEKTNVKDISVNARIFFVMFTLFLVSCGGGSKEKTQFRETAQGIWQTDCRNLGLQSEYSRTTLTVGEASFEYQNDFFEDPLCRRPTSSISTTGTLVDHNSTRTEAGTAVSAIDFSLEQIVLSASNQVTADSNNAAALCDRFDWQPGVMVDVSIQRVWRSVQAVNDAMLSISLPCLPTLKKIARQRLIFFLPTGL